MLFDEFIYQNIKSWIGLYGTDILDLIFPIKNCDTLDPKQRYTDTEAEFYLFFDKHINAWFHFAEKIKERTPAIAIDIQRQRDVSDCFAQYTISFLVTFTTTAPMVDTDGNKRQFNIGYSEQNIYAYRDKMINELRCMMSSTVDTNSLATRTVFSDMLARENWAYPLQGDVYDTTTDNFRVYNEMISFRVTFSLDIENLKCEPDDPSFCDECEED